MDTNVLAYAEGTNGTAMRDRALELIQRLPPDAIVLPVQTLGELFNVVVRKAKRRRGSELAITAPSLMLESLGACMRRYRVC